MSDPIIVAIIASVASLPAAIITLIGLWIQHKKAPAEVEKLIAESEGIHATAAEKSATVAAIFAKQVGDMSVRIGELEALLKARSGACETCIEELEKEIAALHTENEKLRQWAERLAGQVVSLGTVPVK